MLRRKTHTDDYLAACNRGGEKKIELLVAMLKMINDNAKEDRIYSSRLSCFGEVQDDEKHAVGLV
jgi:hypothetical protein